MSRLTFNRSPYFDDYQSDKNFMKILFRPGRAVQTRELNQIQSIFQNQIEKFANHIFKNGSRVSNARANYMAKAYVRLQSKSTWIVDTQHPDGYDITDLTIYPAGTRLVGQTSGVTAILVKSVNAENTDPPTIYVVYTGTGIDGVTATFIPGEVIRIFDSNGIPVYSVTVKCPGCVGQTDLDPISPVGLGNIFTIDEGVFYFEGMFIENARQDIIISKYGEQVDYKVGFDFVQRIIESDEDTSILDNALGYPNQSAPGADRYKVDLILTRRTLDSADGENFILLAKFEKGNYYYFKADSEYSEIMDMIAKRTYETNGNYTVRSFKVRFIEDRAETVNDPNGYSVDGDDDYVRAVVGPGISYVKGYRYESTGERFIKVFKARDVQKTAGFTHTFEDRTHIFLQPLRSYSAYPNDPAIVSNTDETLVDVYDGPFSTGKLPTGSVIGSFKVFDVKPDPTKGTINAKGVVQSITVVNQGSGYTAAPTVNITGGGGSGAQGVATIANGKVISVTITTGGSNYEFAPTVEFTGGSGSGASAKAVIFGPAVFKYYIYDVEMIGTHKLNEGKSFVDRNQTHGFKAVPYSDDVTIYNPNNSELIWKLSRDNIKTLRSIADEGNPDPPGTMAIMLRRKMTATVSGGQVTFTSNTSEFFQDFDPSSTVGLITDNDEGAGVIHTVDLSVPGRFTRTPTSITITLGDTLDVGKDDPISTSGNSLTIIHNTLRTNGQEDSKEIAETEEIVVVPTTSEFIIRKVQANPEQPVADFISLMYVYQYDPANLALPHVDVTEYFTIESGISETGYRHATMKVSGLTVNPSLRWRYKVKYYNHNHSKNLGFFTIDSYRDLIADGDMQYEENPTLTAKNKKEYPLFGCLDFRPTVLNGVTVAGNVIPVIGSTAIFDISYYLGRIDILCVNKEGELYVKGGTPSDSPKPPKIDDDSMALYEIHFDPFTYSTADIKVKYIENKRYTMRDIGRIEERLKIVEYYTALNLLEKSAEDMSIKDANGLDRFKNGFIADNFQDYQAADTGSSDFRAALDRKSRELRPSFTPRNKKLLYLPDESDAFELGKMAMIEYTSVMVDEQPFATKHISINPHFQFKKMGVMVLTPNNDVWSDVTRQPDLVVNVDTGVDALRQIANAAGVLGTEWGSWRELNRTVNSDSTTNTVSGGTQTTTTTTTTSQQQRTGVTRSIESRTDSYDMGDRVTDVSIQPYMRNVAISFYATKMKANTKVWAYFDKKPVSEYTRALGGSNGMQLVTDPLGQIGGVFDCPGGVFFTGDRKLYLTADEKLTGDPDLETTAAEAVFFSGGLNVSKQKTTMNVTTPVVTEETVTDNRTVSSTSTNTNVNCNAGLVWNGTACVPPPPPPRRCSECGNCAGCSDPIAQSFKLERDYFITGFDVYFAEIDSNPEELFFQLRTMVNGYPGPTVLGEKKHQTSELTKSADSKTPFHIEFDFPIFCAGKTEYCFVIGGFSPDTRAWVAKLGQEIIDQPGKIIETQPTGGSSFRSQNASTWNAEQLEDIKYKIYAAKFKKREMTVAFEHQSERLHLDRDPFEAETGKTKVRVTLMDHGFVANDKVTISMLEDEWIEINIPAGQGQMNVGMVATTVGGFQGTVYDYRTNQVKTEIRMKDIKGTFAVNDTFNCAAMDVPVHDNYLITKMGFTNSMLSTDGKIRYNTVSGTFKSIYSQAINGIPISELSKQHIIQSIDSMDSFIIQVTTPAASSGRFGGEEVYAQCNEKYEVFNVTGAYLPYGSSEVFTYRGIGHNPLNGPFAGDDYAQMTERQIVLSQDNHLGQPHKIVSDDNAGAGGKRVRVVGTFEAPDEWTSPIVNYDTFSVTTVSNRVEWVTLEQLEVEPNASGRYRSERDPMNGSGNYKYVTRTIVLKNPATDLVIAFDVYKDLYADFDLWLKVVAPYEDVDINTKQWMRIVGYDKTHNSVDLTDRIELELTMSELQLETDDGGTLIDWDELPNDEFSQFKVKIVGQAKNPAKPPLFQSFRAIAVT